MAFTKTPEQDTYRTETVRFDQAPSLRAGDITVQRDCNIVNMYYDRISQEDNKKRDTSLRKRPGYVNTVRDLNKVSNTDPIRGWFYEPEDNYIYWAVGNKVYRNKFTNSILDPYLEDVCTLDTSTGLVGFEIFQKATTETYVIFTDGSALWSQQVRVVPGVAATKVTDPDLPAPHLPYPVVMDGYVFLAKGNTIYNSVNDTFDSWDPADFIDAEMSADNIVALARNVNYVVAFGKQSLEVFWNAANDTGSPLSRNTSGYKSVGFVSNLARIGDELFFVGQEHNKNLSVFKLKEFSLKQVSDEVVDRFLQNNTSTTLQSSQVKLDNLGKTFSTDGHTFYCMTTQNSTWVYEVKDELWYEWRDGADAPLGLEATFNVYNGGMYAMIAGSNFIAYFSPTIYQDNGVNFTCSYTTQELLFGSPNKKVCNRAALRCDRHLYSGSSLATIAWSDDDWSNGITSSQQVNVFSNTPFARRCGQFINRSFRITYTDNYPIRMKELSLELNIGAH